MFIERGLYGKGIKVSINENDIAKIAVLNSIRVEDVDSKF